MPEARKRSTVSWRCRSCGDQRARSSVVDAVPRWVPTRVEVHHLRVDAHQERVHLASGLRQFLDEAHEVVGVDRTWSPPACLPG